jgi:hypothetical protein
MIDYLGHDAEGRPLPNAEFQASIERYYTRSGLAFKRPLYWDNPPVRAQVCDGEPKRKRGGLSEQDWELLYELRGLLEQEAGESEGEGEDAGGERWRREADVRARAMESLDAGDNVFERTADERGFLQRARRMFTRDAAGSRLSGLQKLQAAYDKLYHGVAGSN